MKHVVFCILFFALISVCLALQVPVSDCPVITDTNLISGFLRVTPEDKAAETLPTKVWMWQDEDILHVQLDCEIDSTFVAGKITTRDVTCQADYIRFQLVTIPDAYFSYIYFAFPLGNLVDGARTANAADLAFNSTYNYTSKYSDKLWQIHYQIPLGELRFKQQLPYRWKIIITRSHKERNEAYNLPFVTNDMKNDYFSKAYDIELSQPIKRSLGVSLRPYLVKSYDLIEKTDSFDPDKIGLDVTMNPGQRTRLKLSMNPDFSDTPPDYAADNYNSKYPPYYQENRFFFTEDIDAFGVGSTVFYSRRIVQPRLAFKATGNTRNFNWGVLSAFDKEIRGDYGLINRDDYFQVLSFIPTSKKLRLANAVVSRMNDGYYNHVYSGNYSWEIIKDITLTSNLLGSIRKNEAESDEQTEGYRGSLQLNTFPGEWNAYAYYGVVSKDLACDAGYLNQKNFQNYGGSVGWDKDESKDYITYQGASIWGGKTEYFDDGGTEFDAGANYYINLRPEYGFDTNVAMGSEQDDLGYSHDNWGADFKVFCDKLSAFSVSGYYSRSNVLVYDLYDTFDKDYFSLNLWGDLTKTFSYDVSGSLSDFHYPKNNIVTIDTLSFPVTLDNRYAIINGIIIFTPSRTLRFSGGISMDTYESEDVYAHTNIYGNLRYEFKPDYFLYLGYSTRQFQDEKSLYASPMGHFVKNSANAYVKVSIKI
ncbi:MAG: hypothetical protein RBS43_01810 [Candidatus Cloacimonas sp.]|jgi:hypothetical protein|nr:hypothetical protein [Candidatus Cloacimonas sp.]